MQSSTFSSAKEMAEIERKATKKIIFFIELFIIVSNREVHTYIYIYISSRLAETYV
jgi:hypothetical protein